MLWPKFGTTGAPDSGHSPARRPRLSHTASFLAPYRTDTAVVFASRSSLIRKAFEGAIFVRSQKVGQSF